MKFSIITIFLFCSSMVLGQNNSSPVDTSESPLQLVYNEIRDVMPYGTIYYVEKAIVAHLDDVIKQLFARKVVSLLGLNGDTILLTKAEVKYLTTELKKSDRSYWPGSLFNNSKSIPTTAFNLTYKKSEQKYLKW
ncbi:MAG: hypothetical protein WCF67_11390 [Chitinophagaceae bacterium]